MPFCSMMIATYQRDHLLPELLEHLTTTPPPSLRHILIIWQNIGSPLPTFLLPPALSAYAPSVNVSVRMSKVNSMNERFRPILDWGEDVRTEAVMIFDDDIVLRRGTIEWGYQEYLKANPKGSRAEEGRIVGFAGRDFQHHGGKDNWSYDFQPMKQYSMVLSNAAWFRKEWLELYWAEEGMMPAMRDYVDEGTSNLSLHLVRPDRAVTVFNCDDLLVNYLVSNLTHLPPLMLQPQMPVRTIQTNGLWNRGLVDFSAPPTNDSSPPSPPPISPPKLDHFSQRSVCLGYYFKAFAPFAPDGPSSTTYHYPLVRTSTTSSEIIMDRAHWLAKDESWENPVPYTPYVPEDQPEPPMTPERREMFLGGLSADERERVEFEEMLRAMTDEEVEQLVLEMEELEAEDARELAAATAAEEGVKRDEL